MRKEDLIVQLVGTKLEDWSLRPFGNGEAQLLMLPWKR